MVGGFPLSDSAYIVDRSETPLFNGDKIYLRSTKVVFEINNLIESEPIININEETENFNSRKGQSSYQGFNSPIITLRGNVNIEEKTTSTSGTGRIDNSSSNPKVVTVYRLWKMALTPRKYYLWDSKIINSLITDDEFDVSYTESDGIPVAIRSLRLMADSKDTNKVVYELKLLEDRE